MVYVKDVLCLLADDAKQSKLDIQLATPRGSVGGLVKDAVVRRVISPQDILDTLSQVGIAMCVCVCVCVCVCACMGF